MTAIAGLRRRIADLASALVLDQLRRHSPKCAVPPSKQARNGHTQRQSQPSTRATVAYQSRHCSCPSAWRSFAHTFRVSQIPIAERAAPPRTIARGFVPWRLSDAGHRHVAPSFMAGIRNPAQERTWSGNCSRSESDAVDGAHSAASECHRVVYLSDRIRAVLTMDIAPTTNSRRR